MPGQYRHQQNVAMIANIVYDRTHWCALNFVQVYSLLKYSYNAEKGMR